MHPPAYRQERRRHDHHGSGRLSKTGPRKSVQADRTGPGSHSRGSAREDQRELRRVKALLSHKPGGPETLRIEEVVAPIAGAGELLVRVRACAINFPDVLIIEDKYQLKPQRPFAPGGEIAGEV